MDNSSCSTNMDDAIRNRTSNSTIDSTRNQGDLREIGNNGDLRDVTDKGGKQRQIQHDQFVTCYCTELGSFNQMSIHQPHS